jgi:hypothetical protein
MTDIGVAYTLTTPGGTITFNSGAADQYYLNKTPGLHGIQARVPVDKVPYGDGGIVHPSWKEPRHFTLEGSLLILSTHVETAIVAVRNDMEEDLEAAAESILAPASGTLAWTPTGKSARSLTVHLDEQGLQWEHVDNYQVLDFVLALVAADPDAT